MIALGSPCCKLLLNTTEVPRRFCIRALLCLVVGSVQPLLDPFDCIWLAALISQSLYLYCLHQVREGVLMAVFSAYGQVL